MKILIRFLVFASASFLIWMNVIQVNAGGVDTKSTDGVGVFNITFPPKPTAPENSLPRSFGVLMISRKTSDEQSEFSVDQEHGYTYVSINDKNFDDLGIFLQNQKNRWHACGRSKPFLDDSLIRVGWSFNGERGEYCLTSNDAISLFDEFNRISLSSTNKEFSFLMLDTLESLKQMQMQKQK